MSDHLIEIRRGHYFDSLVLMQLQAALAALPGIEEAGVVMGTPANLDLLDQNGLRVPGVEAASPDDLLIVLRAASEREGRDALEQVDRLLRRDRGGEIDEAYRPRTLAAAAAMAPEAGWVLVSVPGRHAAGVAREALSLDRHVFLFSDNVPLDEEVVLKRRAAERGLLLMGPDCGTAIVGGVGLGFANRVRRGPIGLVAASGTGLQAVAARIHALGGGVSHALGTGGRDLAAAVGGQAMRQGIALLAADPATEVIVLVSKPPDPAVAREVLAAARATGKPVVVAFVGFAPPAPRLAGLHFALGLEHAAALAVELAGSEHPQAPLVSGRGGLRGLFSGGTLAQETERLLTPLLGPELSLVDLGEDEFTVGRPHPMLDNQLRLDHFEHAAADPDVGVILLDIVLGDGAHPDPAVEWAPAIARQRTRDGAPEVVIMLVGTDEDPQAIDEQAGRLVDAGARVERSVTAAALLAASLAAAPDLGPLPAPDPRALEPKGFINVGLEHLGRAIEAQGARALHVEWRPPAGGDERLMSILGRMRGAS